jgi:hypothetical protein
MSFRCDFHEGNSEPRTLRTVVVTEWRAKEYPAVELPKLFGDPGRRYSSSGTGYEAAVTKNACHFCAPTAIEKAPQPPVVGNHRSAVAP